MSLVAEAPVRSFGKGVEKPVAFVLQMVSSNEQLTFVAPEAPM
jgi:hypothetical protein